MGGPAGYADLRGLFGGRRATNVPLVNESFDWNHGVFLGATIASSRRPLLKEPLVRFVATRSPCCRSAVTTWRRTGVTGWTSEQRPTPTKLPKIYQVNWFRKDADGNFIWPGFGDNSRVLAWIIERLEGNEEARDTAMAGCQPKN